MLDVPESFNGSTKVGGYNGSCSGCVAPPEHRSLLPPKQYSLDRLTRRRPAPTQTEPARLPKDVVLRVYSWILRATVRSALDDPAAAVDQRCSVREGQRSAAEAGRIADEDRPCVIDAVEVPLREVKKVGRCEAPAICRNITNLAGSRAAWVTACKLSVQGTRYPSSNRQASSSCGASASQPPRR